MRNLANFLWLLSATSCGVALWGLTHATAGLVLTACAAAVMFAFVGLLVRRSAWI